MSSVEGFLQKWATFEATRMAVSTAQAIVDVAQSLADASWLEAMADEPPWIVSPRSGGAIDARLEAEHCYWQMAAYVAAAGLSAEAASACATAATI